MRKRSLMALVVGVAMTLTTSVPALAEHPTPADGQLFGQHVSGMSPEHPLDHGQLFGECVGSLASEGTCTVHE